MVEARRLSPQVQAIAARVRAEEEAAARSSSTDELRALLQELASFQMPQGIPAPSAPVTTPPPQNRCSELGAILQELSELSLPEEAPLPSGRTVEQIGLTDILTPQPSAEGIEAVTAEEAQQGARGALMRLCEASQCNPLIAAGLDVAAVALPAVAAVLTGVRGPAFDPRQPDQIGPALGEAAGQLAGTATAAIPGAGPFIAPVASPALGAAGAAAGLAAERAIRGQEQPSAARPGFETGIS